MAGTICSSTFASFLFKEWTDSYFGTLVHDPYRDLEDLTHPQTKNWIAYQKGETANHFNTLKPLQEHLANRLLRLWQNPKYSVFTKQGFYYFFWGLDLEANSKIQNQAVFYRKDSLTGPSIPVLDPNLLDPEGNTAINYLALSRDGSLVAYSLSQQGSDQQTIRIRDTVSLFDYPEVLEGCTNVNIAWKLDNSGFFYNRFVPVTSGKNRQKNLSYIFWHRVGTSQSEDKFIYRPRKSEETFTFYPEISQDGSILLLYVTEGTAPDNRVYYREVDATTPFKKLGLTAKAQFVYVGNKQNIFYFQTTWHAPLGRIIAVDLAKPQPRFWQTIVPEEADNLAFAVQSKDKLTIGYLHKACHGLKKFSLGGDFEGEIELPAFSTVSGITGRADSSELFISLESFITPPAVYRYDLLKSELEVVQEPAPILPVAEYETNQIFFPSKDGTHIPMFLTYKKGLSLNGNNPTLLTAYGGFGISQTPIFRVSQALWLEQGGILAVANIRGGGEFGAEWYAQGRLERKQNCFDDFCMAAKWLINHKYTSPHRLAILGHSNGGLLVAGSTVQAPELFGAVVCQAPLTDMLRYQKMGSGSNWLAEYSCAETSLDQFKVLYDYSPLHNVRRRSYPAVLVTVSRWDERVHPMHSFKFIAALQNNAIGETTEPILLRVEEQGGHGLGNAASRTLEELIDIYTFLFDILNMT